MTLLPQEIIARKRDGAVLSRDEITGFITGLTSGAVTDAQAAALPWRSMSATWRSTSAWR